MDKIIRDSIFTGIAKVVHIGMVLVVCSAVAAGQDRVALDETNSMVYNGIRVTQDAARSPVLNTIISIHAKDVPLLEAVKEIAAKANLEMVYNSKLLEKKNRPITIRFEQVSVEKALWSALEGTGLRFAVSANKQLVLLERRGAKDSPQGTLASAQETITGTVTDAQSGETLPGVNILVKGTSTGASTDADGQYELEVESLQDTLVVSFVGYKTQQVPINGRTEINIQMQSQAITGEEMVVVGYGKQEKKSITGAISSVNGANISDGPSVQASSALIGKAAGVTVRQSSGQPGSDEGDITIRGIGTLGDSNPLILIDGVRGELSDVAPSNIASVSVLKDAASAAIYGSRAANGVVLVETKRGTKRAMQVHYNGHVGWQEPTRQPDFVDAGEFMKFYNMANKNVGNQPVYSQDYINQWQDNHLTDPDHYPNTDWVNAVFTEPGLQQKQHLSVSGGSDKIQYFGSLSYDDQRGNIVNYGYKRYSIRLNTDIDVSKQWHFIFDVNAIRKDQKSPSAPLGSPIGQAYRLAPIYIARYSDGTLGPGRNPRNPVAALRKGGIDTQNGSVFKSRLKADFTPFPGLELSLRYLPEYRDGFGKNVQKQYSIYGIDTKDLIYTAPPLNSVSENNDRIFNNNVNFTVKYQKDIQNHQFKILGGYEFINHHIDSFSAYRDQLSLQDFEQLDVGSLDNQQNSGTGSAYALQSVFGRLNYNYGSKYLFEANIRYDGSSRFAKNRRYGLFPSFSAGWRLSNEPFMRNVDTISDLKLRASWGKLGNQQIGTYPYQAVINLNQSYLIGAAPATGAAQLDLANPEISWETTESVDIGLDLGLWHDQLDLSFDYYQKETSDILLKLPIPLIIGLNAPYQNAGAVKNTGWEIATSYKNNIGEDFHYSLSLNLSRVHNEVTDLRGAGPFISGNSIIKVGEPINAIYGYESEGYFNSQEEIDNSAKQTGNIAPGDIKYKDQLTIDTDGDSVPDKADGIINALDKQVIGDPFPHYSYGFNISANYKGFDLSASFQGVGKKDIFLHDDAVWAFYNGGKMREWQRDYWTPDNQNAAYPRLVAGQTQNNFNTSSHWVYNAAYLRLRNLQLGYNIPIKWTKSLLIKKLRVYFTGQNLFTGLDNMPPGVSPNVPNNTGGSYYPVSRVYTFGLDLNF